MHAFKLDNRLELGSIIGGVQSDGGRLNNGWELWRSKGLIKDGVGPSEAAGHWERWRDDVQIMRTMGMRTCRVCLDWARIEPKEGSFDEEAVGHVAQQLYQLRASGIKVLLTFHRFSDPLWFLRKGGWEKKDNILSFLRYVEKILRTVGHLTNEYMTFDEPNLYAINGYYLGIWPPGKKSASMTAQVMSVMAAAHIRCYKLIHAIRRELGFDDTLAGCSVYMRVLEPKNPKNPLNIIATKSMDALYQTDMAEAMLAGRFNRPLKNHAIAREGVYADFVGLGYYTRTLVSGRRQFVMSGVAKNDIGWEIWPEGIAQCALRLRAICPAPVYVTANGVSDSRDEFGCRFIYDHLKELGREGDLIERYYYRNFLDGFEWLEGESARFGLVAVDSGSKERSLRKRGEFFRAVIENGGVTEEIYEEYVAPERYRLR